MKTWYAVQTKPRQETTAEQHLKRQGFETYAPKIRLRKRKKDKWAKVIEPLFPRYLFIQVDTNEQSLAPVRSTQGVSGLVRFGHLLQPVPNSVINYLKQAENPKTRQHNADDLPHKPGDTVDILAGPLSGLKGIFQSATAEERALLLVELLGRQNRVNVSMDAITASN